jgi:dUTP pyrophosphatase
MELFIVPTSDTSKALYESAIQKYMSVPYAERDAALDAFVETECVGAAGSTERLILGCKAAAYDTQRKQFRAFWLLPRSSISKSPLRMANSVGLIDAGYRGVLMGAVDFRADFTARVGERYFQIAGPELLPWSAIHLVSEIPGGPTLRGEGGFGSTGLTSVSEKIVEIPDMGYFF